MSKTVAEWRAEHAKAATAPTPVASPPGSEGGPVPRPPGSEGPIVPSPPGSTSPPPAPKPRPAPRSAKADAPHGALDAKAAEQEATYRAGQDARAQDAEVARRARAAMGADKGPAPTPYEAKMAEIAALSPKEYQRLAREADAAVASLPKDQIRALMAPIQGDPQHEADLRALAHVAASGESRGALRAGLNDPGDPDNIGASVRGALPVAALAAGRAGTEALATGAGMLTGGKHADAPAQVAEARVRDALNPAINEAFTQANTTRGAETARGPADALDQARVAHANENKPAIARAYAIQATGGMDRKKAVATYLKQRTQELLNAQINRLGGEEKVPSGPERDALEAEAKREATAELITLSNTGQWSYKVRPEDLDPEAPDTRSYAGKVWDALFPRSQVTNTSGGSERTENLPWGFVNTVLFSPLYGVQAGFDVAAGEDFSEAFVRNVEERRDPMTARIDADADLRANLASGDANRVAGALADPAFLATAGILLLTPDALSAPIKTVQATARIAKNTERLLGMAEKTAELRKLLSPVDKGGEGLNTIAALKRVNALVAADEEAYRAAVTQQALADKIAKIEATYAATGDIEAAAQALEDAVGPVRRLGASVVAPEGQVLAKALRDAYFERLYQDPEVVAYLQNIGVESGKVPATRRAVPYGAEQARRQGEIADRLEALAAQKKDIVRRVDGEIAGEVAANPGDKAEDYAGLVKQATVQVDAEMNRLTQDAAKLKALEQAKAGEAKFPAAMKAAGDDVVREWGAIARGEEAPAAPTTASPPTPAPVAPPSAPVATPVPVRTQRTPEDILAAARVEEAEAEAAVRKNSQDFSARQRWKAAVRAREEAEAALSSAPAAPDAKAEFDAAEKAEFDDPTPANQERLRRAIRAVEDAERAPPPVASPPGTPVSGSTSPAVEGLTAAQARRVADAKTPEDLLAALRGVPDAAKDAVARKLGAVDFAALQKTLKGTDEEVAASSAAANAEVVAARQKVLDAQTTVNALVAAPGEHARLAAAYKDAQAAERELRLAEKALVEAGTAKLAGRDKVRKLVEAARVAERDLAALRAAPIPKSRRLLALEQKIEGEQAVLDGMQATDKARAARQAKIDALEKQADALSDEDVANWNDKHLPAAEAKAHRTRLAADEALGVQTRGDAARNEAFAAATQARDDAAVRHAAAQAKYAATPASGVARAPQGVEGAKRVASAQQGVRDATKKLADLRAVAAEIDALPAARANLRRALAETNTEFEDLARALGEQAEAVTTAQHAARQPAAPLVGDDAFAYLEDAETLQRRFDLAGRDIRRLARGRIQTVVENVFEALTDTIKPFGDLEEQSLAPALRRIAREMEGGMKEVSEQLAHATDAVKVGERAENAKALDAVVPHLDDFREGLSAGQMSGEYVALAATGYLHPAAIRTLSPAQRTALVDIVRAWAKDAEAPLSALRENLLVASEGIAGGTTGLRDAQQGDIFLAQAIGYGGVERRAIRDVMNGQLAYGKGDAAAVNSTLMGTFDRATATGGSPQAARGRELANRVLVDPHAYRTQGVGGVLRGDTAVRQATTAPLVAAVNATRGTAEAERSYAASAQALDDLDAVMLEAEKVMKGDVYVPRALRDKILKQVDAAVATTQLSAVVADANAYRNFWKQVRVLGSGTSRPVQFYLDSVSDYLRTATRVGMRAAVKAAARSLPTQMLGAPFMAQLAWVSDAMRGKELGSSARLFDKWVNNLLFASPIDDILNPTGKLVAPGVTDVEALRAARNGGVFENFAFSLTRSVAAGTAAPAGVSAARGAVSGALAGSVVGGPVGAGVGAALGAGIFGTTPWGKALTAKNWRYLQDLQNIAATRRRLAIYVGLLEAGMKPEEAATKAVEVVGDFSRELGPAERGILTTLFPFWSYGKFAARSAATTLVRYPYSAGFLARLEQGVAAGLSLGADVSPLGDDEYGYHPAAMTLEADPGSILDIKADIAAEHNDAWLAQNMDAWETEARHRADFGWTDADGVQHPPAPRASERYARAMAQLRRFSYEEGLRFRESGGEAVPESALVELRMEVAREGQFTSQADIDQEAKVRGRERYKALWHDLDLLGVYWAPSPTRALLPAFAQARPTVLVPKARSQADQGYFNAGTGKYERPGDETRFGMLPQDPLTEGLTVPILSIAAAMNLAGQGAPGGTAFKDLVSGLFQDPVVAQAMGELELTSPSGQNTLVAIPTSVGENLSAFPGMADALGIQRKDKLYHGEDPTASGAEKYKPVYYMKAATLLALYVAKPIIGETTAALDFAAAGEALGGDASFVRGEPDAMDYASIYGNLGMGQRLYTTSPSQSQGFADKEVAARLEAENAGRGTVQPLPMTDAKRRLSEMQRAAARPDFAAAAGEVAQRLRNGGQYQGSDLPLVRAWLVQQGAEARTVAAMTDEGVLARVRAVE